MSQTDPSVVSSALTAILRGLDVVGTLHGEFTRGEAWEGVKRLFVRELQSFEAADIAWAFEQEFKKFPSHPGEIKRLVQARQRTRREAEDRAFRADLSAQARAPRQREELPHPAPEFAALWAQRSRRLREAALSGADDAEMFRIARAAAATEDRMRSENRWPATPDAAGRADALALRAIAERNKQQQGRAKTQT
jgi:hypothetical protein